MSERPHGGPRRRDGGHDAPLVLGVTGHRDIATRDPELGATVARELERLQRTFGRPRTLLLSCLAEGADRLVARLAMEHLGAELVATLPLAPDDYRRDFRSAASRAEFDALLAAASRRVVLIDGDPPEGGFRGAARTRRYACAGAYVVARSEVLIALWDGRPARGVGGTAELVGWMIAGEIPRDYASRACGDEPELMDGPGRVVHIDPGTRLVRYFGREP